MKILTKSFYAFSILLLLSVAGLFLASMLPIPGNIEIKIVKSGSMEPTIPTGSLVFIKPTDTYGLRDIITFGQDSRTQIPTTHRIVAMREENGTWYTTKGDANEDPDTKEIRQSDIIGKVIMHTPYAGFVLDFAKQPVGFVLLIAIPAAAIIIDELINIFREVHRAWRRRNRDGENSGGSASFDDDIDAHVVFARRFSMDDVFVPVRVFKARVARRLVSKRQYLNTGVSALAIVASIAVSNGGVGQTLSYFRDTEQSQLNVFSAGEWFATPGANPHNIVLNEFLPNPDVSANGMNLGHDASNMPLGEWIELYNNGNDPVDVAGWFMTDASGGAGNTHAVIGGSVTNTGQTIIPSHGWLVVYLNKPSLNNTGDSIFLYTGTSTGSVLIDSYTYNNQGDFCEQEPSPGDTNATSTPSGTPGNGQSADCPDNQVPDNKSYARIPDGTGPWLDPMPTPGAPNVEQISSPSQQNTHPSTASGTEEMFEAPANNPTTAPSEPESIDAQPPSTLVTPIEESLPVDEVIDTIEPSAQAQSEQLAGERPDDQQTPDTGSPVDQQPSEQPSTPPAPEPVQEAQISQT